MNAYTSDTLIEPQHTHTHKHLVCWKSTIAGFMLSIMTFAGLISLAMAFGGIGLSDGSTVQHASIFAGISLIVATVVAIFAGSYFSVRLARFKVDVVGCAQGLVVASLMVIFVVWQTVAAVGTVGKAAAEATGTAVAATAAGAGAAAGNPAVQDMIEDSLGGTTLKSEPSVVVRGVTTRLMRGDQEGAKNYLAYQAGLTPAEADARIAQLKAKADELMVKAREATATALKASGWSLFLLIALSAMVSVLGGLLAAHVNSRRTMDVEVAAPARRRETKILERQPAR